MKEYVARVLEQSVLTFTVAGAVVFEASGGDVSTAAEGGLIGAVLRAAYGLLVKRVGDPQTPSVK